MTTYKDSGFTLIELSISLVIIGLIVGGILTGRDLIKAAQVRKVVSELESITTEINTFKLKYNCLPGDCLNATDYFPSATNGNGNGLISQFPGVLSYVEVWQLWYQLEQAGLDPGSYTGTGTLRGCLPGVNVKASKAFTNAGYTVINWSGYDDGGAYTPGVYTKFISNIIVFGKTDVNSGNTYETYAPAITPTDAYNLDLKLDDGLPASGRMMTSAPTSYPDCVTSTNSAIAKYHLTSTNISCGLFYNPF